MADDLNGKTALAGAAIAGLSWSFTRPTADTTTNYTDCAIALRIFELDRVDKPGESKAVPISRTPTLTLTLGNGLTRVTNTASLQDGRLEISQTQTNDLLGATAKIKQFSYVWVLTPVGGAHLRRFLGDGFDGRFSIAEEGYGGATAIKG